MPPPGVCFLSTSRRQHPGSALRALLLACRVQAGATASALLAGIEDETCTYKYFAIFLLERHPTSYIGFVAPCPPRQGTLRLRRLACLYVLAGSSST